MRARLIALALVGLLTLPIGVASAQEVEPATWFEESGDDVIVNLWFFWSKTCPHCREAQPFVEDLPDRFDWLRLHSLEVSSDEANAHHFVVMAEALGEDRLAVPAFAFCESMAMGYDSATTTGAALEEALIECHEWALANHDELFPTDRDPPRPPGADETDAPSILGNRDLDEFSLPVLTLVLAGMDAFNPCAFFVLLFLLSLMVHARDRRRMFLVGGVFVLFSGLVYFAFMAAWLNVFLLTGELRAVTLVAGLVAVALAVFTLKDVVRPDAGPSLSIPESAKPKLFGRMRGLVAADRLPTVLFGTVMLALAANSYELLCTTGFPLVYTRALTLHDLSTGAFYGYLAAYNIVYVIPLLAIVVVFTVTLGSRKLSESEGRTLKLVSGLMMLGLGVILVTAPELLDRVSTALYLLAGAVGVGTTVHLWERRQGRSR